MRLAIVNLTGGEFSGGYRKYLKNMLPRLAGHRDVDALLCISPDGADVSSWFEQPIAVDFETCSRFTLSHLAYIPDRRMAEQIRRFSPDMVFFPVDRYIGFDCAPSVNMVRNMEPFAPYMRGDPLREVIKKSVQRRLVTNSVRLADHTIAVSGFVKEFITNTLQVPENKVSHVYHGLTYPPEQSCTRPASIPDVWDDGFLFNCGNVRPARGIEDAIEACADLKAKSIDTRLVIAGNTYSAMIPYGKSLKRLISAKGLNDRVCWAGPLNDEEVRWCFNKCSLFIMTSRIEACPNITLEAMSHGCASISTDSPPMPEFFGDTAVFYSQGDWKSLSSAVQNAMSWNSQKKKDISERARIRASRFSWNRCVEETVEALENLCLGTT